MLHLLGVFAFTGMLKVPEVQKTDWKPSTFELQDKMVKIGWSCENAKLIINECKRIAPDPHKCVVYAAAIGKNETGAGQKAHRHSLFGVQKSFTSDEEAIKYWVKIWTKKWYKAQSAKHFYSPTPGVKPKTGYCQSEYQANGKLLNYCPNGYKVTTLYLNKFS